MLKSLSNNSLEQKIPLGEHVQLKKLQQSVEFIHSYHILTREAKERLSILNLLYKNMSNLILFNLW